MTQIHQTAVVHKNSEIGENVVIGPYAVIDEQTQIADGVKIGPHVVVHKHVSLGGNCVVHAHAVLGDLPQDLVYQDVVSYVRVGAGTTIREGVTIHRGTKAETTTAVGENCYLMANSHLAHNVRLGDNVVLANGALLAGYVEVGERAFISGNCVIHQFVRIGRLAMLGGNSGLSQDVPPFCTAASVHLNALAGINVVGLRRAGISAPDRLIIKRVFAVLFRSGLNVSQAVEKIRREEQSPYAREICDFIAASKRGVCAARISGENGE
ncbi:MAG: acyl-ACP--UDP-N-acetylglucosamine O-acyltransferase [Kiritimatiellae bacterium]|nr:acyl-ACP--UDP-N-acetylglucosamine O-acyltransferase [Kiritimatiellia bacterium]